MKKNFTLAQIFQDNMMFQANKPIRIFGQCKKNVEITVKILNQEKKIRTIDHHFLIEMDPISYMDKAFSVIISSKKQEEIIYQCLVGDIYLFMGGKNINQSLSKSTKREDYFSSDIRFYQIEKGNQWLVSGRDHLDHISVLSYLFAKNLHQQHKSPIGILVFGKDDENIFSWSASSSILSDKEIKNYLNGVFQLRDHHLSREYQTLKEHCFNLSIFAIVLYQGENDFQHFHFYEKTLDLLIKTYRMEFKDLFLPVYIVQMSSFENNHKNYIASSEIRIAQSNLCSDKKKLYIVSVVDIDEKEMVSLNKTILSQRLVKLILEKQYSIGKNTLCPQLFSYRQRAGQVDIYIHNNFLSLVSKSGQKLGFYYTDNTVDFYPITNVNINNNQISLIIKEDVREIRYAYDDNPTCDIFASNGLPLLPFKIILD